MATFTVTHQQIVDNVAIVQTLESTDILVGQTIVLTDCDATINGTHTVFSVPIYFVEGVDAQGDLILNNEILISNQLLFQLVAANIAREPVDPVGLLTWTAATLCTWATVNDLTEFLGIAGATANDTAFMTSSVSAANAYCFKRRGQAGYKDQLATPPDDAVLAGTVLFAASLYRERGSIDSFQSFQDMAVSAPVASMGRINSLLGIKRAQVA